MRVQWGRFAWVLGLVALLLALGPAGRAQAQEEVIDVPERPFRLPFVEPPGPTTWLWGQPFGNTTGAYRQRFTTYGASGGTHFGMDLGAPCGTEIVAIADGVVFAIDGPFGSPPHNLMIDHPQYGYASMYGHLLERPNLVPGQAVKAGEVVAKVGDSGGICYRRPHLHLEIRDLNHIRKYNPQVLIDANWDNLAMTGSEGRAFARDLAEPRKWQSLYDQPEVQTGGPIVNDFADTWPFDWGKRDNRSPSGPITPQNISAMLETPPLSTLPYARQLTTGDCCTRPYWSRELDQIRFIDRPAGGPLGIWAVDPKQPETRPQLITERLALYSPDGKLIVYPDRDKGVAVLERLDDGQRWEFNTDESPLSFTPDSQHVIWFQSEDDGPSDNGAETLWMAGVDGSEPRRVYTMRRTTPVTWLSNDELLMSRRIPGSSDQQLLKYSLADGRETELQVVPQMRGLALSPDRRYLVYQVTLDPKIDQNGTWLLDLQALTTPPQRLPFFGTYRWRDSERLIHIPFEPEATEHIFYEYDLATGQSRRLFPASTGLYVANNDWLVSPDGRYLALLAVKEQVLDGIWVLDLESKE